MRECFRNYLFEDIDNLFITESNGDKHYNYIHSIDGTLFRNVNGKEYIINKSIYEEERYKDVIFNIYKKLFIRILKEKHIKNYDINNIDKHHSIIITMVDIVDKKCYEAFKKLYKLYMLKLDK